MATFFNEYFAVTEKQVEGHGAFNISIINDLPLFIDPFLLFHSPKPEYQALHSDIIKYMSFLRDAVVAGRITDDLEKAWFLFPEVRENWLGFSLSGNGGSGLGPKFAAALRFNLAHIFRDFGREQVTRGSHIEKVCLVSNGVGRDNISDFATNMLKDWLCRYTQTFARNHIQTSLRKTIWVKKAIFNYDTETWERRQYELPMLGEEFVLLTPRDLLTRDENWINRPDMIRDFDQIPVAIEDAQLRGQVSNYFHKMLVRPDDREPTKKDRDEAAAQTLAEFPELFDYYIRLKESDGKSASDISSEKVAETKQIFDTGVRELQTQLANQTSFYKVGSNTYEETHKRLRYLKDVIENKGGHRIFYHKGVAIQRESDLQILFRFVWFGSPSDVGTEANDGRGPVDYKVSRGAEDKTLVEFKLAKNTQLERNLQRQVPIYQAASDAKNAIKAIIYFTADEHDRVNLILKGLGVLGHEDIVLIDARSDNKPSGSKAR